jgi:hypothetical protein
MHAMAGYGLWVGPNQRHELSTSEIKVTAETRWRGVALWQQWQIDVRAVMRPRRTWRSFGREIGTGTAERISLHVHFPRVKPDDADVNISETCEDGESLSVGRNFPSDPFSTHIRTWKFWQWRGPYRLSYELEVTHAGEQYSFSGELLIPAFETSSGSS